MSASLEVVRFDEDSVWNWEPRAAWNFIFAVQGDFEVAMDEDTIETLTAGDVFHAVHDGVESLYPVVPHVGGSTLISIQLWR